MSSFKPIPEAEGYFISEAGQVMKHSIIKESNGNVWLDCKSRSVAKLLKQVWGVEQKQQQKLTLCSKCNSRPREKSGYCKQCRAKDNKRRRLDKEEVFWAEAKHSFSTGRFSF